jgi:hypothetical protein
MDDRIRRPVVEAFPDFEDRLCAMLVSDATTSELGHDYDLVVEAFDRFVSSGGRTVHLAREYHGLRLELESAILSLLRAGTD